MTAEKYILQFQIVYHESRVTYVSGVGTHVWNEKFAR